LHKVIVGLSVVYIIGYNGMIAAYAWLTGGEIPSQRLRSYTFGIASAVGFAGAWLATFTAPYFINPESLNWGPEYGTFSNFLFSPITPHPIYKPSLLTCFFFVGWIWGPSCFITVIWVYFYLPEIKNRTLEEIDEMFEARLPARKFRKYVCTGRVLAGDGDEKLGSERRDSEKEGSEKDQVVHREVVDVGEKGA
jgi:SP family sugar:H+ symporter-like MFS transporter